jgi:hypothetical protein
MLLSMGKVFILLSHTLVCAQVSYHPDRLWDPSSPILQNWYRGYGSRGQEGDLSHHTKNAAAIHTLPHMSSSNRKKPSNRSVALDTTAPLTQMSTRNLPGRTEWLEGS